MTKPVLQVIAGSAVDSRTALRELYARYGGSVYGRCEYLLRDRARAEDAMQDVFAKALVSFTDFRAEASPLTWLTKIATHHCLNLMRADRAPWHQRFRRQEEARPIGHAGRSWSRIARRCASCWTSWIQRRRRRRFTTTLTR